MLKVWKLSQSGWLTGIMHSPFCMLNTCGVNAQCLIICGYSLICFVYLHVVCAGHMYICFHYHVEFFAFLVVSIRTFWTFCASSFWPSSAPIHFLFHCSFDYGLLLYDFCHHIIFNFIYKLPFSLLSLFYIAYIYFDCKLAHSFLSTLLFFSH